MWADCNIVQPFLHVLPIETIFRPLKIRSHSNAFFTDADIGLFGSCGYFSPVRIWKLIQKQSLCIRKWLHFLVIQENIQYLKSFDLTSTIPEMGRFLSNLKQCLWNAKIFVCLNVQEMPGDILLILSRFLERKSTFYISVAESNVARLWVFSHNDTLIN